MKRFWIGLWVLTLLLAIGLGVTYFLEQTHRPISQQLAQASQAALDGNWSQALVLFNQAEEQWDACGDLTAAFADHSVLESADGLFAEIRAYAKAEDPVSFAAGCAQLSRLINAIAESYSPKWQNFL